MKIFKERRLYYFTCEQCGKVNRHSFKRSKAKNKLCKRCRGRAEIDKNQLTLFGVPVIVSKTLPPNTISKNK